MSEGALQNMLVREMTKLGLFVAEVNYTTGKPTGTRTTPGFPDLVLFGRGRAHLWELKTPEGRLNDNQVTFHRNAADAGYYIPVVRSLDDALLFWQQQFNQRR
jgi:hypothetical protein